MAFKSAVGVVFLACLVGEFELRSGIHLLLSLTCALHYNLPFLLCPTVSLIEYISSV